MTQAPGQKAQAAPDVGVVLKEIRQGTAAQQKEILQQLNRSQPGQGIDGAERLLQFLEDRVHCLEAINAPEGVKLQPLSNNGQQRCLYLIKKPANCGRWCQVSKAD